jgi:autophagy-related protein 16
LKLVDIRKYEAIKTYRSPSYRNGVHWNRAAVSPDGQFIAAGSADGVVHVWNLQTAEEVATLQGHKAVVEACSWSAMDQLASVDKDKRLILWQ